MALSIFDDKAFTPNDDMVPTVLGASHALWKAIKEHLSANYKKINEEWKFYGKESGWTKNIKSDKRTLFMFVPMRDKFQVYFTLGEKAVTAVHNSDLPKEIKDLIPDAKQCVCGFGFRFDVKSKSDANAVIKLTEIKNKN
ncbi:MAG: DUF3788 domain-containing protein [Firmicutes bacterium]|nr:DUF3788 domain-containing protein [Bacillota bacterium]